MAIENTGNNNQENQNNKISKQETLKDPLLAEAERLGTNLEKLDSEIKDLYGSVDEFKAAFEKPIDPANLDSGNLADKHISELAEKISKTKDKEYLGKTIIYLTFILSLVVTAGEVIYTSTASTIEESVSRGDATESAMHAFYAVALSGALASAAYAIRNSVKAFKLKQEKSKEELKFKMSGVELKDHSSETEEDAETDD